MIIPNKHDGYRAGRRLYHFGGGGGGGGPAEPAAPPPPPPRLPSAAPPPVFQTYGSGDRTGSLVQSGNSFRPSTLDYSKPIYDPNYADNITGYQESSQFFQPIQQQQYTNYANPLTAFNVSSYGTNPSMSKSMQAATAPGAGGVDPYYAHLRSYGDLLSTQGDRNNINTLMQDMRQYGISAQDLQNASSSNPQSQMQSPFNYSGGMGGGGGGGGNTLTPEIARNLMQRSMMGGVPTSEFAKYGGYDAVQSLYDASGGNYAKPTQVSTQPMQFNPYTNSPSYSGGMPQMQSPFSYQQPVAQRTSSGPRQAIVGRSSQMRGAPNVVSRRAEGGITSLLDNDE